MNNRRMAGWVGVLVALTLLAPACSGDDDSGGASDTTQPDDTEITLVQEGSGLASVKSAGTLKCGTRDALPGFAVLEGSDHVGFDADFCRVIAAAILGDANAVDFVDLETEARFTALQSGEIDVLVRNTTWTAGRDGAEGATFLQPNYYDGQGMMVNADSEFQKVADMDGTSICVAAGTTTEGNVASEFEKLGIDLVEVLSFSDTAQLQDAFIQGRCDGWSSDTSQLTGFRSEFPDGPDALRILPDVFSKEPLAPAVRDGDTELAQAVDWAIFATIQAEEFGITSSNIGDFADSDDPNIRKFLGVDEEGGTFDPGLGLPADFAKQVITQVGNYAEIFEKNLAPLGLERGPNRLWSDGGLLYAPPYR